MNDKKNVMVAVGVVVVIAVVAILIFLLGGKSSYKVTFNSNGGSPVDTQEVKKGDLATEPADPTRDGYSFSGWFLSLTDSTPFDFRTKITKNIDLIAKWASNGSCNLSCGANETLDPDKCECVANTVNPQEPDDNDDDNEPSSNVPVTGLKLNVSSKNLNVGDSFRPTLTISPSNATNKSVTWKSSNTSVASVSANGTVTAKAPGEATITVTSSNGKSASFTVKVADNSSTKPEDTKPVSGVTLSKGNFTMTLGDADVTVVATVEPNDASDKTITWKSSKEAVATVVNGKIHAVGTGTAVITATASNGKSASLTVTVNPKQAKYEVRLVLDKDPYNNSCLSQYKLSVYKDGEPLTAGVDYTKITGPLNWKTGMFQNIDTSLVNTSVTKANITLSGNQGTVTADVTITNNCN